MRECSADVASDFKAAMQDITRAVVAYEHSPQRRLELRRFIDTAGPRVARKPGFPRDLIEAADHAQWPIWAVECLPSLFVRDEPRPGERGRALVWHYLLDCVEPKRHSIRRKLCGGCIFEVELPGEILVLLDQLAPTFEECRLRCPCTSLQSMTQCVIQILDGLIARGMPDVTELRKRLLRSLYYATLSVDPQRKPELEQELRALRTQPDTFPKWALSTLSAA